MHKFGKLLLSFSFIIPLYNYMKRVHSSRGKAAKQNTVNDTSFPLSSFSTNSSHPQKQPLQSVVSSSIVFFTQATSANSKSINWQHTLCLYLFSSSLFPSTQGNSHSTASVHSWQDSDGWSPQFITLPPTVDVCATSSHCSQIGRCHE